MWQEFGYIFFYLRWIIITNTNTNTKSTVYRYDHSLATVLTGYVNKLWWHRWISRIFLPSLFIVHLVFWLYDVMKTMKPLTKYILVYFVPVCLLCFVWSNTLKWINDIILTRIDMNHNNTLWVCVCMTYIMQWFRCKLASTKTIVRKTTNRFNQFEPYAQ